jgi:hypothetical protein
MQVSALSTIIAAQQARTAAPPVRQTAVNAPEAPKTAAPATAAQEFAPLSFAQAPAEPSVPSASAPPAYPANARIGSQVDIRV